MYYFKVKERKRKGKKKNVAQQRIWPTNGAFTVLNFKT